MSSQNLMLVIAQINTAICFSVEIYNLFSKPRHHTAHYMAVALYAVGSVALAVFLLSNFEQFFLQPKTYLLHSLALLIILGSTSALLWLKIDFILPSSGLAILLILMGNHIPLPLQFFYFHIAAALMGFLIALGTAAISLLFLWQQNLLKQKKIKQMNEYVPALDVIERVLNANLWIGFAFLTAALLSGAFVLREASELSLRHSYIPKIFMACFVWGWFFILLLTNKLFALSSKNLAKCSLLGASLLSMLFLFLQYRQILS